MPNFDSILDIIHTCRTDADKVDDFLQTFHSKGMMAPAEVASRHANLKGIDIGKWMTYAQMILQFLSQFKKS